MNNYNSEYCRWIQDKLLDFPNHLIESEKDEVRQHIKHCNHCKENQQENEKLKKYLNFTPGYSNNLRESLIKEFKSKKNKKPVRFYRKPGSIKLMYLAAATILFALALNLSSYLYLNNKPVKTNSIQTQIDKTNNSYKANTDEYAGSINQESTSTEVWNDSYDPEKAVVRLENLETGENYSQNGEQTTEVSYKYNWETTIVSYNPNSNPDGVTVRCQ